MLQDIETQEVSIKYGQLAASIVDNPVPRMGMKVFSAAYVHHKYIMTQSALNRQPKSSFF